MSQIEIVKAVKVKQDQNNRYNLYHRVKCLIDILRTMLRHITLYMLYNVC